MHSEGYLLISNVVYTNQIGFCFKHLPAEENQFQDSIAVIFQAKDPFANILSVWQCKAADRTSNARYQYTCHVQIKISLPRH